MRLHIINLLLVGLSHVNAGIFQRQCYPETVIVTKSLDPVISTSTCTETLIETRTITAHPHKTETSTMTTTNFLTINGPTLTITETMEGLSLSSSAAKITNSSPNSSLSDSQCTGTPPCTQIFQNSVAQQTLITYSQASTQTATSTMHILSTAVVVPMVTIPSGYYSTNDWSPTVISLASASTPTETMTFVSIPTINTTVTIGVTETIHLTSFVNASTTNPPFPTLNITGTMGISPSGSNGTGTMGTMVTNGVSTGMGTGIGTDVDPVPGNPGPSTVSISNTTASTLVRLSIASTLTQGIESANLSASLNLTTNTAPISTLVSTGIITTSQRIPAATNMTDGALLTTPAATASIPSSDNLSTSFSANVTQAHASKVGDMTISLKLNSTAAVQAGQKTSAASTGSVRATNGTVSSPATRSRVPSPNTAANGPFSNATSPAISSRLSSRGAGSLISPGTTGPSASLNPRCALEGPFDWRQKVKRENDPVTMTFPNGQIVTKNWDPSKSKRQIGQIITATINGQIETWVNNWDGSNSVDLSTVQSLSSSLSSATSTIPFSTIAFQQTSTQTQVTDVSMTGSISITTSKTLLPSIHATGPSSNEISSTTDVGSVSMSIVNTMITAPAPTSSAAILFSNSIKIPTDQFPTFKPPAWLTSEIPIAPTKLASTHTILSEGASVSQSSRFEQTPTSVSMQTAPTDTLSAPAATCTGDLAGDFTVSFDDLPHVGEAPTSDQYPPLINPYHKLLWSQGYSYVPPPSDPYPPHSGSQLGVFVVDGDANVHSQNWTGPIPQGDEINGMFGAGKNYKNPHFFIDAIGVWIRCSNAGPADCDIQVNGFTYDEASGNSVVQVAQHFYQPPCPGLKNCSLEYIQLNEAFHNLSAVQIQASQQGDAAHTAITWYMDDLALAWTDNSCAAVQARGS